MSSAGLGVSGPPDPTPFSPSVPGLKDAEAKHHWALFKYRDAKDTVIIIGGVTFAILQGLLPPFNMLLLGSVVTVMGSSQDINTETFNMLIIGFAALAVCGFICGTFNAALFELLAGRAIFKLKRRYFKAITRQDISLFDTTDIGTLAAEIEQTCVNVRDGTGMKLGIIFQAGSQFVAGYAVGLMKSWQMTLVLGAAIPIMGSVVGLMMLRLRKLTEVSQENYEQAAAIAEETLSSMRTIASFSGEAHMIGKYEEKLKVTLRSEIHTAFYKALGMAVMFGLLFLSYAFGWWYAGRFVSDAIRSHGGAVDEVGGDVVTVFFAIMIASYSMSQLMPNIGAVVLATRSVAPVHAMIDRQPVVDPYAIEGVSARDLRGDITFSDVRFAYPTRPDRPIYDRVSFQIKEGETVALVGPSGCGKSTIVQLLERFYSPTRGDIFLSGVRIGDYNVQSLRRQMALVSQEPKLFADSVFKNIECGLEGASMDEVVAAAKKANAHGFIMDFPQQYMTNVGEGGGMLSGGQKQRIALARALLRDPKILILDEATSALDNESEKIVQQALEDVLKTKSRTTIIIAHRLTTIRNADRIIVVDNPKGAGSLVVENGTHDELMKLQDGLYRALVMAQSNMGKEGALATIPEDLSKEELVEQLTQQFAVTRRASRKSTAVVSMLRKYSRDVTQKDVAFAVSDLGSTESKMRASLTRRPSITEQASKLVIDTATQEVPVLKPHARKVFPLMKDDWLVLTVGGIAAAITGFSWPIASVLIAQFVGIFFSYDTSKTPEDNAGYVENKANVLGGVFAGIAALVGLGYFIQQMCFGYAGEKLVDRMRRRLFAHMIYQDMEFFDSPHNGTGHLSAVLTADTATLRAVSGDNLAIAIQNLMTVVAAILISFGTNAKLASVCVLAFCLVIPANLLQGRLLEVRDVRADVLEDTDSTAFVMHETLTSLRVIAAYGLQEERNLKYRKVIEAESRVDKKNAWITGCTAGFAAGISFAGNALSYWYGGTLLMDPNSGVDLTKVMRTILVIMMAANGIGRSTAWATDSKRAKAATRHVFEILDHKPSIDVLDSSGATTEVKGELRFEKLRFRYPHRPDTQVLNDISFDIKEGETVAIVGASGCGKSTIVQLLQRFYDVGTVDKSKFSLEIGPDDATDLPPDLRALRRKHSRDGRIVVDGTDITDYNLMHWRKQVGIVPQEPGLFSTTIKENIRWGKWDATDEEIVAAAKMANADEFIMKFPDGYDEDAGKGGSKLSGGQKQRVAIARAIVRDPRILLLDEATSALDRESEEIVQRALDDLLQKQKRTTVIIAHRLSTVKNADKIVVFSAEHGVGSKVVEVGDHKTLMRMENGVYRHLVEISECG